MGKIYTPEELETPKNKERSLVSSALEDLATQMERLSKIELTLDERLQRVLKPLDEDRDPKGVVELSQPQLPPLAKEIYLIAGFIEKRIDGIEAIIARIAL